MSRRAACTYLLRSLPAFPAAHRDRDEASVRTALAGAPLGHLREPLRQVHCLTFLGAQTGGGGVPCRFWSGTQGSA